METRNLRFATQPIFRNLVDQLSHFALSKINHAIIKCKRATHDNPLRPCSRIMVDSMGLPCTHAIQQMGNKPLSMEHVNSFWRVSGNNVPSIAPVPVNNIAAMLTAINNQFQKSSGPHQKVFCEQLEKIQSTLSQSIAPPTRQATRGRPPGALVSTNPKSHKKRPNCI